MIYTDTSNCPCGPIRGIKKEEFSVFLGIPFALAPVDSLSFKKPVECEAFTATYDAIEAKPCPLQSPDERIKGEMSRDCLYLNIWVPDSARDSALPVMVYFYGGSYASGDANRYDMSLFAIETNTITVTFNYRLNIYGFSYGNDTEPNLGLYDQIMALRWIRKNIGSFGGDSSNITLFGQSAGAASILALSGIEEASSLFDKMIIQSAPVEHFHTKKEAKIITDKFLRYLEVPAKEADAEDISRAYKKLKRWLYLRGDIRCAFSPVIDGTLLKDYPELTCLSCRKPMLIGTNEKEAVRFAEGVPAIILKYFEFKLGLNIQNGRYREAFVTALTNYLYLFPAVRISSMYQGKSWRYKYCADPSSHGSELKILFEDKGNSGKELRRIWAEMAHKGEENWNTNKVYIIGGNDERS